MVDLSSQTSSTAAVYLDFGADVSECEEGAFRVCERGMCFQSRWQFEPGTQLAIVLSFNKPDGSKERLDAEATVASCQRAGPRCYDVVALFVDLPEARREAIRTFGSQLEQRPRAPRVTEEVAPVSVNR